VVSENSQSRERRKRGRAADSRKGLGRGVAHALIFCAAAVVLTGCSANHYRRSADKEVYRIIREKQEHALGHAVTNFSVDTPFSKRNPDAIPAEEIIGERVTPGTLILTVQDALNIAASSNRTYQANKETLYLKALTLTADRYQFTPMPLAGSTAQLNRNTDRSRSASVTSQIGVGQLLQTGTKLSAMTFCIITAGADRDWLRRLWRWIWFSRCCGIQERQRWWKR